MPHPDPAKKPLSVKERVFVKAVTAGLSGAKAAVKAGSSPKSAKWFAHDVRRRPHVQIALLRELARRKLTMPHLLDELSKDISTCNQGIATAARVISVHTVTKPNGEVENPIATGKTDDFIEVPDHHARIGYLNAKQDKLETAMKLQGFLTPRADEVQPRSVVVVYGHQVAMQTTVQTNSPPTSSHANGH